jgi:hypothetical protein
METAEYNRENRMTRHQTGYIFESKSEAFHVRYYTPEIVDGQAKRVQRSHLLCRKDNKHFSKTCKAVKLLRDEFMRTVNAASGQANEQDMKVTDFWEQHYLPFVQENMKPSTVSGYKQIWSQHLRQHFGEDAHRVELPARSDQDAGTADAQPHSQSSLWHFHARHQRLRQGVYARLDGTGGYHG